MFATGLAPPAPPSAQESEYGLWVGQTAVTAQDAQDVLGDGAVSYNADSNTLTLNGAEINDSHP